MPAAASAEPANLRLDEDECLTLSPTAERFKGAMTQLRPQTIAEVRRILGPPRLSPEQELPYLHTGCCASPEIASTIVSIEELHSSDAKVQARAYSLAYVAANDYVKGIGVPAALSQWEPVLNEYIKLTSPVLSVFTLQDIEVANKATLTISKLVHVLAAGKIIIHGSGSIVCQGPTTFRVNSVEGQRFTISSTVAVATTAGILHT